MKIENTILNTLPKNPVIDKKIQSDKTNIDNINEKQNQVLKKILEQNQDQNIKINIEDLVLTKELIQSILSLGIPQAPSPAANIINQHKIDILV